MDPRRPVASFCNQQTINNSLREKEQFTFFYIPAPLVHCIFQYDWGYAVEKTVSTLFICSQRLICDHVCGFLIFIIFYQVVCKEKIQKIEKIKRFHSGKLEAINFLVQME